METSDSNADNSPTRGANDISAMESGELGRVAEAQLRFMILDHKAEQLEQVLRRLQFQPTVNWREADMIFAHRATHGVGSNKGLGSDQVSNLSSRNGYYVEYTRGYQPWKHTARNSLRCKYDDLINRLARLRSPVSRNALYSWLALDDEHIKQATVAALAILCQGYIAAYAAATEQITAEVLEDETVKSIGYAEMMDRMGAEQRFRLTEELAGHFGEVSRAGWWKPVIPVDDDELEGRIAFELNELDLSDHPKIKILLSSLKAADRISFQTVAEAYSELVKGPNR